MKNRYYAFLTRDKCFHSNAAFHILETVMNSCAPLCLVHNVKPGIETLQGFLTKLNLMLHPLVEWCINQAFDLHGL